MPPGSVACAPAVVLSMEISPVPPVQPTGSTFWNEFLGARPVYRLEIQIDQIR